MTRPHAPAALFSLALSFTGLAACTGNLGSDMAPAPDTARQQALGIVCGAELKITGQFRQLAAKPADIDGCWPVGTWSFSASVVKNDCPQAPVLAEQYSFAVTRNEEGDETYQFLNDLTAKNVRVKVTSGGGGLCEGGVMVFSADGKTVVNLKPALQADGTLNGKGDYDIYEEDQR